MTRALFLLVVAALLAGCGGGTAAQPPARTAEAVPTTAPTTETEAGTDAEPETRAAPAPGPGLPAWTAGYADWSRLNAQPIPPRDADPHLSTKNVYASMEAVGGVYPPGTIVVKEGVRPGTSYVGLIAAMRKVAGANPEHRDWVFVEWSRDAAGDPFSKLAEGAVCEACHSGVADQDYVFTKG